MRKLVTFFVAILATTALLAQIYDFQVGDLMYQITSEQPYTVAVVGCNPNATSVEIPSETPVIQANAYPYNNVTNKQEKDKN